MKIVATTLGCDGGMSGIGRYAASLLAAWSQSEHDLHVHGHDQDKPTFFAQETNAVWHNVSAQWMKPLQSILWHQLRLPQLCHGADVLFLPAGNRRLPLVTKIPTVATVHDCSSMHITGKYDKVRDTYIKEVLPRLMRGLDHIITVSDSTRLDLVQLCGVDPSRISVIPLAADAGLFNPKDPQEARSLLAQTYGLQKPFLLYTARIEHPGKNHIRLIQAWESLRRAHKIPHHLVFVGPEKERAEVVRKAAVRSEFSQDILFVGTVPASHLPFFYSAADLFVFPSLYEGFGLPILESLSCGTPVACSDRSSLPEVGGDCVFLFDPDDPRSIDENILHSLEEAKPLRQSRVQAGIVRASSFTWERTARETMRVLEQVGNSAAVPAMSPCGTLIPGDASNLLRRES